MPSDKKLNKSLLIATAEEVAQKLKVDGEGTLLKIRIPTRASDSGTDGWRVKIGVLENNGPDLEIWLDRFAGYSDRKYFACFVSDKKSILKKIIEDVPKKLYPTKEISSDDVNDDKGYTQLTDPLPINKFNVPIFENYSNNGTFLGIYDPTRKTTNRLNTYFINRAAAFFEDIARSLPNATTGDEHRDMYPRLENRNLVTSHLLRERSRLLATDRKIEDDYKCQICGFQFEKKYGKIGADYAEAHHIIPLHKLSGEVRTQIEDLITVCANCHRMLHRMEGKKGDIIKLKQALKQARK